MSIEVNKVIRDGQVAVLVSPGYGAGWSTWASGNEQFALFDSRLVDWVEGGKVGDIDELVKSILGEDHFYTGGGRDLEIEWLPIGTAFRINEYDGAESLETFSSDLFHVA